MWRHYSPSVFAVAAALVLAVAAIEMALGIELPRVVSIALLVVCLAGLLGTVAAEGTGRVYPLPPRSAR